MNFVGMGPNAILQPHHPPLIQTPPPFGREGGYSVDIFLLGARGAGSRFHAKSLWD